MRVTCSLPKWSDPKQLQPTSTETLSAWRRALANYLCCEARKRVQGSASCYHVCIAFSCLAYYQPGGQTEELASVCSYQRASRSQSLAQRQQAVHCSRHYTVFARLGCWRNQSVSFFLHNHQEVGLQPLPGSDLLQTRLCPRRKNKKIKSHLAAIRSRNAESPCHEKVVITIQLETLCSLSLKHFTELYLPSVTILGTVVLLLLLQLCWVLPSAQESWFQMFSVYSKPLQHVENRSVMSRSKPE